MKCRTLSFIAKWYQNHINSNISSRILFHWKRVNCPYVLPKKYRIAFSKKKKLIQIEGGILVSNGTQKDFTSSLLCSVRRHNYTCVLTSGKQIHHVDLIHKDCVTSSKTRARLMTYSQWYHLMILRNCFVRVTESLNKSRLQLLVSASIWTPWTQTWFICFPTRLQINLIAEFIATVYV